MWWSTKILLTVRTIISLSFMDIFNVDLQIIYSNIIFSTFWTFVVPSTFMNQFNMFLQITCCTEILTTLFTVSLCFMNLFDMSVQMRCWFKILVALFTNIISSSFKFFNKTSFTFSMFFQIAGRIKSFSTFCTFVIFSSFMDALIWLFRYWEYLKSLPHSAQL